jgi:predicted nucleotidyltransferase
MNAAPFLSALLDALTAEKLEAVLIGNAAAAVLGAPVTTLDFDFMFRDTVANLAKLKRVAKRLDAVILRPFYPVSRLYRMTADSSGLQADFMPVIHGVRSFESLRSRAVAIEIDGRKVIVAALDDVIASKRAAGRERDLAVLPILERTAALLRGQAAAAAPTTATRNPPGGRRGRAKKQDR